MPKYKKDVGQSSYPAEGGPLPEQSQVPPSSAQPMCGQTFHLQYRDPAIFRAVGDPEGYIPDVRRLDIAKRSMTAAIRHGLSRRLEDRVLDNNTK